MDSNSIHFVQHHSPLGSSDHECLSWQYECLFDNPTNEGMPVVYNYWKGNYLVMCQELDEVDWESLFSNNSIDENWNLFKEEVASVVSKYVPMISKKVPTNKPPWWTRRLAKAIKQKQQLYSTFRHTHSPLDYVAYTHKRKEVKSQIRSEQAKYDQQLIDRFHTNPKALYGYMRNKSGLKPTYIHIEGCIQTTCMHNYLSLYLVM